MSQAGRKEYQETDSDSIPFGWQICKLGDLVTKVGSGVTPKGGSQFYLTSGVPLIRSQNVLWGKLDLSDVAYISVDQHLRMTNSALQPLDVLLNITGASIGRCAVLPECFSEGNVNQHVCIIRPAVNLQPNFLSQYLNSQFGQEQILKLQAGGNREGLNYQQIRGFSITLPSLLEQKKIAAIISCVDNKLDVIGRQIETTHLLKQGLMQTLFSRGVASGWPILPLSKVAVVRTGITKGKTGLKDPVELPYLRVANVQDGHIDLGVIKSICVESTQVERYSLQAGDVLMTEGGDFDKLGRGDVWNAQISPCLHQNHVFAVRPDANKLNSYYLAALSASGYGKKYFISCAKRTTNLASINSTQLKAFPVLLPPIDEQRRIAEIVRATNAKIKVLQTKKDHYQTLKRGLMQKLLTGEWRVKLDDSTPTTEQ